MLKDVVGREVAISSTRSPSRSLARRVDACTSVPERRAMMMRSISSALPDRLSLFIIFMRSDLDTPSGTSNWHRRLLSLHRVHTGLMPSHLDFPLRHGMHATATARRLFFMSRVGRCFPGSSETGAMFAHLSEGSMRISAGSVGYSRGVVVFSCRCRGCYAKRGWTRMLGRKPFGSKLINEG